MYVSGNVHEHLNKDKIASMVQTSFIFVIYNAYHMGLGFYVFMF